MCESLGLNLCEYIFLDFFVSVNLCVFTIVFLCLFICFLVSICLYLLSMFLFSQIIKHIYIRQTD